MDRAAAVRWELGAGTVDDGQLARRRRRRDGLMFRVAKSVGLGLVPLGRLKEREGPRGDEGVGEDEDIQMV